MIPFPCQKLVLFGIFSIGSGLRCALRAFGFSLDLLALGGGTQNVYLQ